MTESGYKTPSQRGTQTARDMSLSHYYNQQREMLNSRRSSGSTFRMRIVTNNFRGKPIDQMTEQLKKADNSDTRSIYQVDYTGKRGSYTHRRIQTAQGSRALSINLPNEELNSNPPNTQRMLSPREGIVGLQINPG